jgi:hypothetical protein
VRHHVGGENHVAWLSMPLCPEHHRQLHALLAAAGVNLEYTPDPVERRLRALIACQVTENVLTQDLRDLNCKNKELPGNPNHA